MSSALRPRAPFTIARANARPSREVARRIDDGFGLRRDRRRRRRVLFETRDVRERHRGAHAADGIERADLILMVRTVRFRGARDARRRIGLAEDVAQLNGECGIRAARTDRGIDRIEVAAERDHLVGRYGVARAEREIVAARDRLPRSVGRGRLHDAMFDLICDRIDRRRRIDVVRPDREAVRRGGKPRQHEAGREPLRDGRRFVDLARERRGGLVEIHDLEFERRRGQRLRRVRHRTRERVDVDGAGLARRKAQREERAAAGEPQFPNRGGEREWDARAHR